MKQSKEIRKFWKRIEAERRDYAKQAKAEFEAAGAHFDSLKAAGKADEIEYTHLFLTIEGDIAPWKRNGRTSRLCSGTR